MIVWGGMSNSGDLNDGGRYNPATDAWTALPITSAPTARLNHTAVWTGSEMIVWGGGRAVNTILNDGGRYNPAGNSWTAVPTNGAPARRDSHTAVWTGSEMIIWGGSYWNVWDHATHYLNNGGRYNPAANSWTAVPTNGAPAVRQHHTAVWTGSEIIVYGGQGDSGVLSETWSYYPYSPAVRISCSSPVSADVAWPVWSTTLRLRQITNLAAGQWTTVTNTVTQVGSENHVTLSPLSGSQFFRVEHP
jgi:N-acetylneuraminic acid mutarotase